MQRALGLALLAVGIILIVFGVNASHALGSRLSETFTGTPSNRALWLLIGGSVSAVVGLGLAVMSRRSRP